MLSSNRLLHAAVWCVLVFLASLAEYKVTPFNSQAGSGEADFSMDSIQHHYQVGWPHWLDVYTLTITVHHTDNSPEILALPVSETLTLRTAVKPEQLMISLILVLCIATVLGSISCRFANDPARRSSPLLRHRQFRQRRR